MSIQLFKLLDGVLAVLLIIAIVILLNIERKKRGKSSMIFFAWYLHWRERNAAKKLETQKYDDKDLELVDFITQLRFDHETDEWNKQRVAATNQEYHLVRGKSVVRHRAVEIAELED